MTQLLVEQIRTTQGCHTSPDGTEPIFAHMSYLIPSEVRPTSYAYEPPAGVPWESSTYDLKRVAIHDARIAREQASLEQEGFQLFDVPTHVQNFYDEEEVRAVYYPEMKALAQIATKAKVVHVFDHLVRRKDKHCPALSFGRNVEGQFPSANGRIHNDYSESSGKKRLELVIPDASERSRVDRYSIINIWRPINGPIFDTPLAVCDARTINTRDLVVSDIRYKNRVGEVYFMVHSKLHRWSYFSRMDRHEALVFKQYDSQLSGTSRFTPHAAFEHPHCPEGASPRESIEIRCLVVY